jgi:ketosteroid isomerase-like protein
MRARAAGGDRALAEVFADDVVWHVPGRNEIAEEYRGIDQAMEYSGGGALCRAICVCKRGDSSSALR